MSRRNKMHCQKEIHKSDSNTLKQIYYSFTRQLVTSYCFFLFQRPLKINNYKGTMNRKLKNVAIHQQLSSVGDHATYIRLTNEYNPLINFRVFLRVSDYGVTRVPLAISKKNIPCNHTRLDHLLGTSRYI